jgi:hypothetical protein
MRSASLMRVKLFVNAILEVYFKKCPFGAK